MSGRIARRFEALKREGRGGLVTFLTAGDPDHATSAAILDALPGAGADLVELGMPFSDPMADGPAIQAANLRALANGASLARTLDLARAFRARHTDTPLVLMGYYNPIYIMGVERFTATAREAGVDGLIVVDLPPEEVDELKDHAQRAALDIVRLATPTSDDARLDRILEGASGFLYYVAVAGITGTKSADRDSIAQAVARIRRHTAMPVAVGFGIRTPEQAAEAASLADAAVVGSALVQEIARAAEAGRPERAIESVPRLVKSLADAVRARAGAAS
ncbi:MAG: tryptophan synthase subunit alpha [Alphaproteobacteria bacterium]|nr:tryptophan synthase subunit alpha [Alphaproteobacteria bacterium]